MENNKYIPANPITKRGKRTHKAQLLGTTSIPTVLLVGFIAVLFGMRVVDYWETTTIRNTVEFSIDLANVVHSLQKERDRNALYISSLDATTKSLAFQQYQNTDDVS
jgi:hypothetical protein